MSFDYTDHEYLPECKDGCGPLTGWLLSREMAQEAARNHEKDQGHKWVVLERKRE